VARQERYARTSGFSRGRGAVAVAFSLAGRPDAVAEERGSLRRRGHDEEKRRDEEA
jgi:hypothetical protein